jgi:predicted TIM-barrel fold metal-dependent hydrolase
MDREYFHVLLDMLKEHPNLYGDTSAFNVPLRGRHARQCLQPEVASRLVHGSDFPVPVYGHWAFLWRTISWANYRRIQTIPNVLERDYQLKLAMGFGVDHFTRIRSLLRIGT